MNCACRAGFCALAAADTSGLAGLHDHCALVLRTACDINGTILRPLLAKLDKTLGARLDASAASSTLVGVYLGDTGLGIYLNGTELAHLHAVAVTQTAERAGRLAHIERRSHGATLRTVERVGLGTLRTYAAAAYRSHLGALFGCGLAQQGQ